MFGIVGGIKYSSEDLDGSNMYMCMCIYIYIYVCVCVFYAVSKLVSK